MHGERRGSSTAEEVVVPSRCVSGGVQDRVGASAELQWVRCCLGSFESAQVSFREKCLFSNIFIYIYTYIWKKERWKGDGEGRERKKERVFCILPSVFIQIIVISRVRVLNDHYMKKKEKRHRLAFVVGARCGNKCILGLENSQEHFQVYPCWSMNRQIAV